MRKSVPYPQAHGVPHKNNEQRYGPAKGAAVGGSGLAGKIGGYKMSFNNVNYTREGKPVEKRANFASSLELVELTNKNVSVIRSFDGKPSVGDAERRIYATVKLGEKMFSFQIDEPVTRDLPAPAVIGKGPVIMWKDDAKTKTKKADAKTKKAGK